MHEPAEMAAQLMNVTGPIGEVMLARVRACAVSRCSGNGRCMPLDGRAGCQCYSGHNGATCEL